MHDKTGYDRDITRVAVDEEGERTFAEKDALAILEFNKKLEEQQMRERKLLRQYEWRGNKLPPFSIEPMPHERQRLDGAGMTAEDRALRRQWLKDQELSPNEPRYIPEAFPKNPFRRVYGAPWDALFNALRPYLVIFPDYICARGHRKSHDATGNSTCLRLSLNRTRGLFSVLKSSSGVGLVHGKPCTTLFGEIVYILGIGLVLVFEQTIFTAT